MLPLLYTPHIKTARAFLDFTGGGGALTFVFGLKRFALLSPTDCNYLKVVFFGGVKVLDEQLCFLLRYLNLRLLSTCSEENEQSAGSSL